MTDHDIVAIIRERDLLGEAAFAAYLQTGGDTDGASSWQEFFRPVIAPAWSTLLADAVKESIEAAETEAKWATDLIDRLTTAGISITIHGDAK